MRHSQGQPDWDTPTLPGRQRQAESWDAATRPMSPAPNPYPAPPVPPAPVPPPLPPQYPPQYRPNRVQAPSQPRPVPPPLPPNLPRTTRPVRRSSPQRRWRWGRAIRIGVAAVLLVLVVLTVLGVHRLLDFGQAISTRGPLTTQTGFMNGIDRVNLLVLGYGGGSHDGANLTDSMMVISVVPHGGATTEISVPRDLWVQVPPNSGSYAKINSAYQDGLENGYGGVAAGKIAGGNEAAQKVSDVLGIKVNYWLAIDFTGFRSLVDAVGGVDINVPTGFTAQYPANDDPSVDASWKTITFKAGEQHMNGEQAIEYARARYVTNPASEGTDFARSARQQLLIRALLDRLHNPTSWPGFIQGTDALQQTVYTNLSLLDLSLYARKMDTANAARIGLSTQNVLVGGESDDGQDILLPANGDWSTISTYIASHLKS